MNRSLLPSNSTPLERAVEMAISKSFARIPLMHRAVWNPDTCPEYLLPWLAWALGVEVWRSEWPVAIKRSRIKASLSIHRHNGTVKAVKDAVRSFGAQIAIREWFETDPPGVPRTFQLTLTAPETGSVASEDLINDVIDEVNRTKPEGAHFTFVQGLSFKFKPVLAFAGRPITYVRMGMDIA